MQRYILFHRTAGVKFREYSSLSGARRGMRIYNRNAGWTRGSRCSSGLMETEWCHAVGNTDQWEYGPYAIVTEQNWAIIRG